MRNLEESFFYFLFHCTFFEFLTLDLNFCSSRLLSKFALTLFPFNDPFLFHSLFFPCICSVFVFFELFLWIVPEKVAIKQAFIKIGSLAEINGWSTKCDNKHTIFLNITVTFSVLAWILCFVYPRK